MKKLFPIISVLIFLTGAGYAQTRLTAEEAAERFEKFIVENGYTDLPPAEDKSKLVAEPLEGDVTDFVLSLRKNTLERKPFRVTKGNRFSADGWTAIFLYREDCRSCDKNSARVVYLDASGENPRFEHQDLNLKNLTSKIKK